RLTPLQSVNRQLRALANGEIADIRFWEYCNVSNALPALDASDAVLSSTAHLRATFDSTFGRGKLVAACPMIVAPGAHYPPNAAVKVDGNRPTVSAGGWEERKLIRHDNVWRQDLTDLDWTNVLAHFKIEGLPPLPVDGLIPNLHAMSAVLDRTAT